MLQFLAIAKSDEKTSNLLKKTSNRFDKSECFGDISLTVMSSSISSSFERFSNWLRIFFFNGIHSMQGWTATMRHGVTRKRSTKRLEHTGNLFRKNLQLKNMLLLDLRSQGKGKHYIGREFQSPPVQGKKLLT